MLNASQAVVNNSNISIGKDHTSSSTNSAIQPNMMASTSRKPSPATANVAANVGSVIHNGGEFSTPISGRTQYTVSQKSSVGGQGKMGLKFLNMLIFFSFLGKFSVQKVFDQSQTNF